MIVKKSQYRSELSTMIARQQSALSICTGWSKDDYACPNQLSIYPDNPCHNGLIFAGIDISGMYKLITLFHITVEH